MNIVLRMQTCKCQTEQNNHFALTTDYAFVNDFFVNANFFFHFTYSYYASNKVILPHLDMVMVNPDSLSIVIQLLSLFPN